MILIVFFQWFFGCQSFLIFKMDDVAVISLNMDHPIARLIGPIFNSNGSVRIVLLVEILKYKYIFKFFVIYLQWFS